MRPTSRLFAVVRQADRSRLLTPNAPTGLTGMNTHPSPRTTLLYLYSNILKKLEQIPQHSVYRQATESLTRKRLSIIESIRPPGYDGWEERITHEMPKVLNNLTEEQAKEVMSYEGKTFVKTRMWESPRDDRDVDWNGDPMWETKMGAKTEEETDAMIESYQRDYLNIKANAHPVVEREPQWTVEQIEDIEQQISAGLIEEVILVAQGEVQLVETLVEHKVWEDLVEKSPEGQWKYFERSD